MRFAVTAIAFATGLLSLVGQSAAAAVYLCTDINFTGYCVNYGVQLGQCSTLPSALNDNISSFGPDKGLRCCIYENSNCGGYEYCYTNPGINDLRTIGNGYINDKTSSVRCTSGFHQHTGRRSFSVLNDLCTAAAQVLHFLFEPL